MADPSTAEQLLIHNYMAITATSSGDNKPKELVPEGNHVARCVSMVQIGTVEENYLNEVKVANKVRITWELPQETRVFNPEKGEQPFVVNKEYTLSMHEKASLRGDLQRWRGKPFTDEEAKAFDITKLLGAACMVNVVHRRSADGLKTYERVDGITPMPKGMECPPQVNPTFELTWEDFDMDKFLTLPSFLQDKIRSSKEWAAWQPVPQTTKDDLPF